MQIYDIQTDVKGKELTLHGSDEFPCAFYDERFSEFISGEVPWHWHDEFEVVYVAEGCAQLECVGQKLQVETGEVVLINAGALHKFTQVGDVDCRILNFVFSPMFLGSSSRSRIYQAHIAPLINNAEFLSYKFSPTSRWQQAAIEELLKAFTAYRNNHPALDLVVQAHLTLFWGHFYTHEETLFKRSKSSPSLDRRAHLFLAYIHQSYDQDISVSDISRAGNVSESECFRVFKKALRCTPNQYLLGYRLEKAANLLIKNDKQVTEIAHMVGFNCPAYFTKRFRLAYGKSPKQFQKEN